MRAGELKYLPLSEEDLQAVVREAVRSHNAMVTEMPDSKSRNKSNVTFREWILAAIALISFAGGTVVYIQSTGANALRLNQTESLAHENSVVNMRQDNDLVAIRTTMDYHGKQLDSIAVAVGAQPIKHP